MSSSINTTVRQIWSKLVNKEYRDSFVSSNIANAVSSQIFALRDQRGWTQKQLAQRAGMAQSRIPTLEDPNLENFEIGTLKRIASAFDVALIVRFVPFSELATWTAELSEEKLAVPDFAHDRPEPTSGNAVNAELVSLVAMSLSNSNQVYSAQAFATNTWPNSHTASGSISFVTIDSAATWQSRNFGGLHTGTSVSAFDSGINRGIVEHREPVNG